MDREIRSGSVIGELDLERIAHEHVANEFVVYHRWAAGLVDGPQCKLELRTCFLKTALVVLAEPKRSEYLRMLADYQGRLGISPIGAKASTNRRERDGGEDFVGRA